MTIGVTIGELAMMRRVAEADTDGKHICAPDKPDRTLEWLSGMGLFEKLQYEGRTAYRITDKGRSAAQWSEEATPYMTVGTDIQETVETRTFLIKGTADGASCVEIGLPLTETKR